MKNRYFKYLCSYQNRIKNKTYIVTGANSGIGFETTRYLLYCGANVIMACRSISKARNAKDKLLEEFKDAKIEIEEYDQSNAHSIYSFCDRIRKRNDIAGLICNAGIYYPKTDAKTTHGIELTIGTNYLGQYLLMEQLLPWIKNQLNFRVVIVTSLTAYFAKDVPLNEGLSLSKNKRYAYSKLLLAREAYELNKEHIECVLTHPGVCSTNILFNKDTGLPNAFAKAGRRFLNIFTHSASKAALTSVMGVLCDYKEGLYIKPRGLFAISGYPCIKKIPHKFVSSQNMEHTHQFLEKEGIYVSC